MKLTHLQTRLILNISIICEVSGKFDTSKHTNTNRCKHSWNNVEYLSVMLLPFMHLDQICRTWPDTALNK